MARNLERFEVVMPDGSAIMAKNRIRVCGDVAFVLSSNDSTEWMVDVSDVPLVALIRWSDARKSLRYAHGNNGKRVVSMHRMLCDGCTEGLEVDHISRDTTDNRRSNLRPVTRSGNASNMTPRKNTSSGYPCVVWDKTKSRWAVQTSVMVAPGKHQPKNYGRFKNLHEACERAHSVLVSLGRFAPPIPFTCL